MCKAMNRSLPNVLLGGWGDNATGPAAVVEGEHQEWTVEDAADALVDANRIIIVPGYGLAVAQAQYAIADLANMLREDNRVRW